MTTNPITAENDRFRTVGPTIDWVATIGIKDRGPAYLCDAVQTVIDYAEFNEHNDPHGEHDFGTFMIDDDRLFWKIDCYDRNDMTQGSEDPADPEVTRRVMTIMLASEY